MVGFYMGKSNRAAFALVKYSCITYLILFTLTTVGTFFIFQHNGIFSVSNFFIIKYIIHSGLFLVFNSSWLILLIMVLSILILIISDVVMFFTKWG